MVPISKGASRGVICEILSQPQKLWATVDSVAVAVRNHDVPIAEFVTVVPRARIAGRGAEVAEVPVCVLDGVLVIPHRWMRSVSELAPGRVIAIFEFRDAARLVGVVAERCDNAWEIRDNG